MIPDKEYIKHCPVCSRVMTKDEKMFNIGTGKWSKRRCCERCFDEWYDKDKLKGHIHKWDNYKYGKLCCSLCGLNYNRYLQKEEDENEKISNS